MTSRRRNRFQISLQELQRSTGHAPGDELVEIEPEIEHHYEPPIRVTPMSPGTQVQAYGQINPPPGRVRAGRGTALVLLALTFCAMAYGTGQRFGWW